MEKESKAHSETGGPFLLDPTEEFVRLFYEAFESYQNSIGLTKTSIMLKKLVRIAKKIIKYIDKGGGGGVMREIKFRAWHKIMKEWNYFDFDQLRSNLWDWDDLDHWGQFTGLEDKNGMDKLCDKADEPCDCKGNEEYCPSCKASIAYNEILSEILRRGKPGTVLMNPIRSHPFTKHE